MEFVVILFLIILVLWFIVSFWHILLGLIIGAILLHSLYRYGYFLPRLKKIKESNLISIPTQVIHAIPIDVMEVEKEVTRTVNNKSQKSKSKQWEVKCILPEIKGEELVFSEFSCRPEKVKFIDERNEPDDIDYVSLKQICVPVKELTVKIKPQMIEFNQKIIELDKMQKLASTSEVFKQRVECFERAKIQVQTLVDDGKRIEVESCKFIRETMIGAKLAKFDSATLPDMSHWKSSFDAQFQEINQKYQVLKTEIEAYEGLKKPV